ncbi:DUF2267 domain-containing protein [Planosporangium thailandense]|uniref:DUF2267 domain-containing protein n=1 Tax=Planosporangium thailandense TaxID=765197 RepID=A0ABX0Y417_9ACTN|nr:DUF2267 domain-containing protein [Planosporangium thailandense]NJC73140.1 DUF2267 domain-containing protein [Planosporangium thailandense]
MAELAFIDKVAERAGVPEDQARALTEATLRTLAERLTAGEADDLPAHLPDQFRALLIKGQEPAPDFPLDEFVDRVAGRAGVPRAIAERGIGSVLQAMHDAVGHKEFRDVMSQLPREFGDLMDLSHRQR